MTATTGQTKSTTAQTQDSTQGSARTAKQGRTTRDTNHGTGIVVVVVEEAAEEEEEEARKWWIAFYLGSLLASDGSSRGFQDSILMSVVSVEREFV